MWERVIRVKDLSIAEVKQKLLELDDLPEEMIHRLELDSRQGVKKLLIKWQKDKEKQQQIKLKYKEMTRYEDDLHRQGIQLVAGIDEVGRGPLAGPVVAAAVILPRNASLLGVNDSKQLNEKKRESFYKIIRQKAAAIGIGIVQSSEIDRINIYQATKKAMKAALSDLGVNAEHLLIDAMSLSSGIPETSLIKGDSRSVSIASASIIAKVTRDRMMAEWHERYPEYQFHKNMGYGTKEHMEAISQYGPTPIHRMSFAPLNNIKG